MLIVPIIYVQFGHQEALWAFIRTAFSWHKMQGSITVLVVVCIYSPDAFHLNNYELFFHHSDTDVFIL